MRHISVLLGVSICLGIGCDAPSAGGAAGSTGDDAVGTTGGDGAQTESPDPDDSTTGGAGSSDDASYDSSTGSGSDSSDDTSAGPSGGTSSGSGGETSSGSDESDSGSESGGESMQGACDFEECVTDCGYLIPDSDEGYGPCWSPVPEHEPWACALEAICPTIDGTYEIDEQAGAAAACLLDALANDTVGRVEYWLGETEWENSWGTIFIVGDGTVLLDMYTGGHCGNGGSYGVHPLRTRAMAIDHDGEALTTCASSDDPVELVECALGSGVAMAASPDSLPWLSGECVATEPACP